MFREINVIPELNYWFRRELSNSSVYDTYHKIPVNVDSVWREPRTVIELLFNETFDPGPWNHASSSSGHNCIECENERPYIYSYRRVNILNITDKVLLNRIQPYRWYANVYAANSEKFLDMFNLQGSQFDPNTNAPNETILPYDVAEEDRSPYITYEAWNGSISNYPLWQYDSSEIIVNPEQPPILGPVEIFKFTCMTLDMLDKLYFYKTGCPWVTIDDIVYEDLDSSLARLIYVYLDAMLNDSFVYFENLESIDYDKELIVSDAILIWEETETGEGTDWPEYLQKTIYMTKFEGQEYILSRNACELVPMGVDDEIWMRVNDGEWELIIQFGESVNPDITDKLVNGTNKIDFKAVDTSPSPLYSVPEMYLLTKSWVSTILPSLYEKHVMDMLYLLRSKLYGVIWKDSVVTSDRIQEIEENFFMILKKVVDKRRVTQEVLNTNEFILEGDNLPWDRRDFTFFKDGIILEQDKDYTVSIDAEEPNNIKMKVILLRNDFIVDELIEFIWSYADPYSAYSEDDS